MPRSPPCAIGSTHVRRQCLHCKPVSSYATKVLTLMESYALRVGERLEGVDAALQAELLTAGDQVSAPWRAGPRKLERFEQLA
jgi:hypothetical protein